MVYTFRLDMDRDRSIIRWLDSLPRGKRSATMRDALTAYLVGSGPSHADLLRASQEGKLAVTELAGNGTIVATNRVSNDPELDDVRANLKRLGL